MCVCDEDSKLKFVRVFYADTSKHDSKYSTDCCFMKDSNNVNVEIFAAGDGINYPKKGQTVTLHYSGFAHGKLFDSVRLKKEIYLTYRNRIDACFNNLK